MEQQRQAALANNANQSSALFRLRAVKPPNKKNELRRGLNRNCPGRDRTCDQSLTADRLYPPSYRDCGLGEPTLSTAAARGVRVFSSCFAASRLLPGPGTARPSGGAVAAVEFFEPRYSRARGQLAGAWCTGGDHFQHLCCCGRAGRGSPQQHLASLRGRRRWPAAALAALRCGTPLPNPARPPGQAAASGSAVVLIEPSAARAAGRWQQLATALVIEVP